MEELANLFGVEKGAGLSYFSFPQILAATDNLSCRNMVGHGGFGYTYKVTFLETNSSIRQNIELLKSLRY
jgi:hypothetical protein